MVVVVVATEREIVKRERDQERDQERDPRERERERERASERASERERKRLLSQTMKMFTPFAVRKSIYNNGVKFATHNTYNKSADLSERRAC